MTVVARLMEVERGVGNDPKIEAEVEYCSLKDSNFSLRFWVGLMLNVRFEEVETEVGRSWKGSGKWLRA